MQEKIADWLPPPVEFNPNGSPAAMPHFHHNML